MNKKTNDTSATPACVKKIKAWVNKEEDFLTEEQL